MKRRKTSVLWKKEEDQTLLEIHNQMIPYFPKIGQVTKAFILRMNSTRGNNAIKNKLRRMLNITDWENHLLKKHIAATKKNNKADSSLVIDLTNET